MMLKGIDITIYKKTETGRDDLNCPIYTETTETLSNVLVAPSSETEALETVNLYGRKAVYTLALPKGCTTDFTGLCVGFFGRKWRVIGDSIQGIEAMIPLSWNRKIRVEVYDGN